MAENVDVKAGHDPRNRRLSLLLWLTTSLLGVVFSAWLSWQFVVDAPSPLYDQSSPGKIYEVSVQSCIRTLGLWEAAGEVALFLLVFVGTVIVALSHPRLKWGLVVLHILLIAYFTVPVIQLYESSRWPTERLCKKLVERKSDIENILSSHSMKVAEISRLPSWVQDSLASGNFRVIEENLRNKSDSITSLLEIARSLQGSYHQGGYLKRLTLACGCSENDYINFSPQLPEMTSDILPYWFIHVAAPYNRDVDLIDMLKRGMSHGWTQWSSIAASLEYLAKSNQMTLFRGLVRLLLESGESTASSYLRSEDAVYVRWLGAELLDNKDWCEMLKDYNLSLYCLILLDNKDWRQLTGLTDNNILLAFAYRGFGNEKKFEELKLDAWNKFALPCEFFFEKGNFMAQFPDTTALRLATQDFQNAVDFTMTESYGGKVFGLVDSKEPPSSKYLKKYYTSKANVLVRRGLCDAAKEDVRTLKNKVDPHREEFYIHWLDAIDKECYQRQTH